MNKFKTSIITLILFAFSHSLVKAEEVKHSAGFGLQFSGLVGYQISSIIDQHNFRASAGVIGVSVGYDYFISDNFSIGATYTGTIRNVSSINFNFYSSWYQNEGGFFGIDVGQMRGGSGLGFSSPRDKNILWLSAGYRFK